VGYSLVIFTNPDVTNIYPVFDIRNGRFISEFNVFYGFQINKTIAIEINPAIVYASTSEAKGYYYNTPEKNRYWYIPQSASLFELPINARIKYFPFGNSKNFTEGLYLGLSAGPVYIKEQYDNYIYTDSSTLSLFKISTDNNDLWNWNVSFSIGISSMQKFGYGFEISYRMIPLSVNRKTPLISSNASNFNSFNLSLKALFGF
jgi:hypothetical protein